MNRDDGLVFFPGGSIAFLVVVYYLCFSVFATSGNGDHTGIRVPVLMGPPGTVTPA